MRRFALPQRNSIRRRANMTVIARHSWISLSRRGALGKRSRKRSARRVKISAPIQL